MGRILQRTSVSTNIKERLDFSCALFDYTGGLVSNAPHIPGNITCDELEQYLPLTKLIKVALILQKDYLWNKGFQE
jgi:5-oxoprolinase (ATP-hydrolysing)